MNITKNSEHKFYRRIELILLTYTPCKKRTETVVVETLTN